MSSEDDLSLPPKSRTKYDMKPFSKLTLNVEYEPKIDVVLIDGRAEIQGIDMIPGVKYSFVRLIQALVLSYHGCTIEIIKRKFPKYRLSEDTVSLNSLLNIHLSLEPYRTNALRLKPISKLPVSMYVGLDNVQKLNIVETLCNYSLRHPKYEPRKTIYVDLNPSQSIIGLPGSIGASLFESASIREGFLKSDFTNTINYCYGRRNFNFNLDLFLFYVKQLSYTIDFMLSDYKGIEVMINVPNWEEENAPKVILKACEWFKVTHLITLDCPSAYNQLIEDLPPFVKIVNVPVFPPSLGRMRREHIECIIEYFFGTINSPLRPYLVELNFSQIKIFNTIRRGRESYKIANIKLKRHFENSILGVVSRCENIATDCLKNMTTSYIWIDKIEENTSSLTVLSSLTRQELLSFDFILTDQKILIPPLLKKKLRKNMSDEEMKCPK